MEFLVKILVVNDIHLSDRSPSSTTESYLDDLFDLIEQVRLKTEERRIEAVVLAGDTFHHKSPHRNSHRLVLRTIDAFKKFSCPVFAVGGNHDLQGDRLDSLFDTQPLGVVIESGALRNLDGWADWGMIPLYGIPWLQEWNNKDDSVRHQAVRRALEDFHEEYDGAAPVLVVTHAPFYPPGEESPWENYPTPDFAEALNLVDGHISVAYGHVHSPHGVYSVDGVQFGNPGALSRGSLHEYNLTRKIAVLEWDSEDGTFEVIDIPHRPADEVFRIEEVQETKDGKMELDNFLNSIKSTNVEITSIESVINYIKQMEELSPELIKLIEELLVEAS